MKRLFAITLILMLILAGCAEQPPVETTEPPVTHAAPLKGWQVLEDGIYCFAGDGTPLTGWITDGLKRCYLNEAGRALTGWQEIGGKRFHFDPDGAMTTGWVELEGAQYYFGIDGSMITGLLNIEGNGYYFSENGQRYSGWLTLQERTYYFDAGGVMAVGPQVIDGQDHYFTPQGVQVILVNPWNTLPQGYEAELKLLYGDNYVDSRCYDALVQMLTDCENAGFEPLVCSAYRTQAEQEYLYNRKVQYYLDLDWEWEAARKEAAKTVAFPGTSEHQLGLAVDIIDEDYPYLDDYQAQTNTQQWLMENCHQYGFILRYPTGTTDTTGIIYEPWHYRYVGPEIAQEIVSRGITLEEYLGAA